MQEATKQLDLLVVTPPVIPTTSTGAEELVAIEVVAT